MEDIKQLTIESAVVFRTGTNSKGAWTLYNVVANGEKYSTFLDLTPGKTSTFKISVEPSEKLDRNGKPYMNRTIIGYTGSIDNIPAKPHRTAPSDGTPTSINAAPNADRVERLEGALQKANADLLDLAQVVSGLLSRVEVLETPAFDAINPKADDADSPF